MVTANHAHPMSLEEKRAMVTKDIAEFEEAKIELAEAAFADQLEDFLNWLESSNTGPGALAFLVGHMKADLISRYMTTLKSNDPDFITGILYPEMVGEEWAGGLSG